VQNTIKKSIRKLRGTHGFKRYLRDGQYSDLESKDQRFYEATEIKVRFVTNFYRLIYFYNYYRNLIKMNVNGLCSLLL